MKTKHTQGKWSQVSGLLKAGDWCIHSQGKHICTMPEIYWIESEANAKLIASAPELLEALIQVRSSLIYLANQPHLTKRQAGEIHSILFEKDNQINNAIEKATK